MKIIDILYKMQNGEEVPKRIKIKGYDNTFTLREDCTGYKWYGDEITNDSIGNSICQNLGYVINCEIEIIEEDKKIEKLEQWLDVKSWLGNDFKKGLEEQSEFNKNIYYKINEIIDYLNKEK